MRLRGLVGSVDGKTLIRDEIMGPRTRGESLGVKLAERLLEAGADKILEEVYKQR